MKRCSCGAEVPSGVGYCKCGRIFQVPLLKVAELPPEDDYQVVVSLTGPDKEGQVTVTASVKKNGQGIPDASIRLDLSDERKIVIRTDSGGQIKGKKVALGLKASKDPITVSYELLGPGHGAKKSVTARKQEQVAV